MTVGMLIRDAPVREVGICLEHGHLAVCTLKAPGVSIAAVRPHLVGVLGRRGSEVRKTP